MTVIEVIENVVLEDDNCKMSFQVHEFKEAIYYMHPDKCLGPNGFNPGFFNSFCRFVILISLLSVALGLIKISFPPLLIPPILL